MAAAMARFRGPLNASFIHVGNASIAADCSGPVFRKRHQVSCLEENIFGDRLSLSHLRCSPVVHERSPLIASGRRRPSDTNDQMFHRKCKPLYSTEYPQNFHSHRNAHGRGHIEIISHTLQPADGHVHHNHTHHLHVRGHEVPGRTHDGLHVHEQHANGQHGNGYQKHEHHGDIHAPHEDTHDPKHEPHGQEAHHHDHVDIGGHHEHHHHHHLSHEDGRHAHHHHQHHHHDAHEASREAKESREASPTRVPFVVSSQWRARHARMERGAGAGSLLFIDAYTAGISGDMMVAALLDLGVPWEVLAEGLHGLGLGDYHCEVSVTERSSIVAPRFVVKEDSPQPFRDYAIIQNLLVNAKLPPGAFTICDRAFRLLAEAEASVHGVDVASVHFHEVGAVDSIVDIVAVALAVDHIGPSEILVSPLPVARGIVRGAAHGPLPLPAPATLGVLCSAQLATFGVEGEGELVTPTGACLAGALAEGSTAWPSFRPTRASYGSGTKIRKERPNLLRLVLGQPL